MHTGKTFHDADLPSPLPQRAEPCPDEDLLSLLRRSASKMGYPDFRWLLRPAGHSWSIEEKEVPLLSAMEDYRFLEHLLVLSEKEIYSHTMHRFASFLEAEGGLRRPPGQVPGSTNLARLSPISLNTYFLPVRSIRVCPLCLREQECYDRLYWRMQLIFYCPAHRVRLLEKCPSCEAPIAAHRQSPYACPRCQQGDYRAVDSAPLAPDNPFYVGELLLLKALGAALPEIEHTAKSAASSPLLTLSDISYLFLLKAITSKLDRIFSNQELLLLIKMLCAFPLEDLPLFQDLFLEKKAVVFLLFHWLFLEWPTHFSTFLDAWYSLSTPPFDGEHPEGVRLSSRSLFFDPLDPDVYTWLHQTYQEYHQQFRQDPKQIDHFRNALNQLAQSVHPQQRPSELKNTGGENERRVYIPPRILTPTTPRPWENLGSMLSRAARKMNHPYPGQLHYRPPFTPGSFLENSTDEVRLPDEASDTTLAYLLQIPGEHLPNLIGSHLIASLGLRPYSLTRYLDELTEPGFRSWFHRYPYRHRTARVCPSCVQDREGYDRVFWNWRGVLCCPRHRVRLLERCPACLKDIPAIRPHASRCPFCPGGTYILPAERIPENSVLAAGTSLLLTMLHLPPSEASSAFRLLEPSPLLTEKPSVYFALLIELMAEIGSYYSYAQQPLLQLCHLLGESAISSEQAHADPYAVDAEVLLFHTIFSHWPERFFSFLTHLYRTVRLPSYPPGTMRSRWRWLLTNKWTFITPGWLFDAFEEHERIFKTYREYGR